MSDDWKDTLTPAQYHVLREKGTEPPFSGKYFKHDKDGTYHCGACGALLFTSDAKFDSGLPGLHGWPSFDEAVEGSIELREDLSAGMRRAEVVCAKCQSHLGHLFDDAEAKTGKHFCINSVALDFKDKE